MDRSLERDILVAVQDHLAGKKVDGLWIPDLLQFISEHVTHRIARERPLVVIESPYAGDVRFNERYARACVADSLRRGEAPIASHLLYTQRGILDDRKKEERTLGIAAGLAWLAVADKSVVYCDLGLTDGMRAGMYKARELGVPIEDRMLFKPGTLCAQDSHVVTMQAPDLCIICGMVTI